MGDVIAAAQPDEVGRIAETVVRRSPVDDVMDFQATGGGAGWFAAHPVAVLDERFEPRRTRVARSEQGVLGLSQGIQDECAVDAVGVAVYVNRPVVIPTGSEPMCWFLVDGRFGLRIR